MTQAEARDYIREHSREYADAHWGRDKSGKGWICPVCGSGQGEGKHGAGTGITSKDGEQHFTCWAQGCFSNADVIDIIGLVENIPETDYTRKFEAARRAFGIELDEPRKPGSRNPYPPASPKTTGFAPTAASRGKPLLGGSHGGGQLSEDVMKALGALNAIAAEANPTATEPPAAPQGEWKESLAYFLLQAEKHLNETDYHRGLSLETLKRFHVGYMARWRHPKSVAEGKNPPYTPRLIIPTSPDSYIARDTRAVIPEGQQDYKKQQVGKRNGAIFNGEALKTASGPIFVTEGEFDAMSVIDVGGEAITAGSAGQWKNVFNAIKATPPRYPVILSLDKDKTGEGAAEALRKALDGVGIRYQDYEPPNGAKDANEALMTDRAAFEASVKAAIDEAMLKGEQEPEPPSLQVEREADAAAGEPVKESGQDSGEQGKDLQTARDEYLKTSVGGYFEQFLANIRDGNKRRCYSTGFEKLDALIGGIRPGLFVVGGVPALGKTSFCLQVADAVAAQGSDVIYVSLEMGRDELIAKSLSRTMLECWREKFKLYGGDGNEVKTAWEILTNSSADGEPDKGAELFKTAVSKYSQYFNRIYILEAASRSNITDVGKAVRAHIELTGTRPLLVLDYLQILSSENPKAGAREDINNSVRELKDIARNFDVGVVCISAFNRLNYYEPVSMLSFRESSEIEYSTDVLIGLQPQYMNLQENETEQQRKIRIREAQKNGESVSPVEVCVLKNRFGRLGSCLLDFSPAYSCYSTRDATDAGGGWKSLL